MALELAVAYVRVKIDRPRAETKATKDYIRSRLGKTNIHVLIKPKMHQGAFNGVMRQLKQMRMAAAQTSGMLSGILGAGGGGSIGGGGGKGAGAGGRGAPIGPGGKPLSPVAGSSRVKTGASLFTGRVGGFVKGSMQIASGILGAQAALSTIAFPVSAIQTSAEFERSMVRVRSVTSATAAEFAVLEETAKRMGQETIFTTNEAAEAMVVLGQKGLTAAQTIQATPVVLNFAAAGRVSPEEAANTLVGIMNAMQISISDLEKTSDVLTRISLRSSADVRSIGESFKYVGPLADLAGMEIEQVASALGVLANVNLGGSIGGTGFKRIIGNLLNPEKVSDLSEMLGVDISVQRDDGSLRELPDIIDEINAAFKGLPSDITKAYVALNIFGERAGPQFAALLQQGGDELRRMEEEARKLGITAKSVAEDNMNTLGGSVDRLKAAFEGLKLSFIDATDGGARYLVDGITSLVNAMANLNFESDSYIATLGGMTLKAGGLVLAFNGLLSVVSGLAKAYVYLAGTATTAASAFAGVAAAAAILTITFWNQIVGIKALNRELEKTSRLTQKLMEKETERQKKTIEKAESLKGQERIDFLNKEIALQEKNLQGRKAMRSNQEKLVESLEKTTTFWEPGRWAELEVEKDALKEKDAAVASQAAFVDQLKSMRKMQSSFDLQGDLEAAMEKMREENGGLSGGSGPKSFYDVPHQFRWMLGRAGEGAIGIAANVAGRREEEERKRERSGPQFVGVKELSKQIQMGILKKDRTKEIADNTKKAAGILTDIKEKMGNGGGVFQ